MKSGFVSPYEDEFQRRERLYSTNRQNCQSEESKSILSDSSFKKIVALSTIY